MNTFLAEAFAENIQRLALGLEPIDSERRTRIVHPFRVTFDQTQLGFPRPPVERHDSCLHVLRWHPDLAGPVDVRAFDSAAVVFSPRHGYSLAAAQGRFDRTVYHPRYDRRRFVPRRLRIPLLAEAQWDREPAELRVRRPFFFPGAAYDVSETATGLRGRVLRNGQPLRWARVEATVPDENVVVGRAHGDDRGEFLLLIGSGAVAIGDLVGPLPLQVTVFAPPAPLVPIPGDLPGLDPLWDLPLEALPLPGQPDAVSPGETLPPTYTAYAGRVVDFVLGRTLSGQLPFGI